MTEQHAFEAETRKLLDLMIHSLYTNKDVFLRELISNASDALDKLRFEGITNPELLPDEALHIYLRPDRKDRTLTIEDNGIGMSAEEVRQNLGTIARSGTQEFIKMLQEAKDKETPPELIGQFGVGFYSAFMVADKITVVTRKAGEDGATRWESEGDGYTLEQTQRGEPGTSITLTLKPADQENGLRDYADDDVLQDIVKRYSDFVAYPIKMMTKRQDQVEDKSAPVLEEVTLNSGKAIWTRPKDEVSDDEYNEFYKHVSHDWNDPLLRVSTSLEGTFNATALLFVPSKAPWDLYHREMAHRGVQLYVKRVFIMDDCRELMPEHLRFVRGVVDVDDLPLNVSRETLQENRQVRSIRKHLVKKVYDALRDLKKNDREKYEGFWREFAPALKEGMLSFEEERERLLELVLAESSEKDGLVGLDDYVERMHPEQDAIYYMTGPSRQIVEKSPHLEAFKKKGYEVLFFTDQVDEVWLQTAPPYKDKAFKSVGKGEVELGTEEERKQAEQAREEKESEVKDLLTALRAKLQDDVKEVRLSNRLTDSPACLVTDEGELTPQMESIMRQMGQEVPAVKRILELNADHSILTKLHKVYEADPQSAVLEDYAKLLYGQSVLAEGGQLQQPAEFAKLVSDLMMRTD